MRELRKREICRKRGLLSFFALDSKTDIGLQDHAHIIATVADCRRVKVGILFDVLHDESFLGRGAAAAHDGGRLDGRSEELLAKIVEAHLKGITIDDEDRVLRGVELVDLVQALVRIHHASNCLDDACRLEQPCTDCDASRCLNLVPREHPHFDPCLLEELQCRADILLELVFDTRHAQRLEVFLEYAFYDALHVCVAIFHRALCFVIRTLKLFVLFVA